MSDINLRIQGKAGRITLQRPEALNAMTYEMCLAIEKTLIETNRIAGIEANLALGLNLNLISSKKPIKNNPVPSAK